MLFALLLLSVPAVSFGATLRTPPNNLGLVGYWSMEDGGGNTATDFSGNGNDGTLTNMDASEDWISGKLGTALDFDGSDDYVDTGARVDQSSSGGSYSFCLWAKAGNPSGTEQAVGTDDGGFDWGVVRNKNNSEWELFTGQGVLSSGVAAKSYWQHVCGVWDSGSSETRIFVDGTLENTGNIGYDSETCAPDIGRNACYQGGTEYFSGKIDEVRIYNRALSASEVRDLYQSGYSQVNTSRKLDEIGGLVGWWTMDGKNIDWDAGSGEVKDASGNTNNGTLNGGMSNAVSATDGRIGQALEFDGSDDYIDISDSISDVTKSSGTITAWVNRKFFNTNGNYPTVGGLGTASDVSNNNELFYHSARDEWWFHYDGGGNVTKVVVEPSTIPRNKWVHVSQTWDKSTDEFKAFINGDKVGSTQNNLGDPANYNSATIATSPYTPNSTDKGLMQIDDFRVYDTALSADEISRIYNATRASHVNTSRSNRLTDGLVGFWTFDGQDIENASSTAEVRDVSGNDNHGDAKNGAGPAIGKLGQGYEFDGSDDTVVTPSMGPSGDSQWSISLWANVDGVEDKSSRRGWYLWQGPSTQSEDNLIAVGVDGGNVEVAHWANDNTYNAPVDFDNWQHVVVTYDGDGTEKVYMDGVLQDSRSNIGTLDITSGSWKISHVKDGDETKLKALMDNIRIYDRTLSADEVKRLYNLGR